MSHRHTAALALFLVVLFAAYSPCFADAPNSATAAPVVPVTSSAASAQPASSSTAAQGTGSPPCPTCQTASAPSDHSFLGRDTLTDHFFGLGDKASEAGYDARLSALQVYQQALDGGKPGESHAGNYSGRYDVELNFNLEKIFGDKGGYIYALGEGDWGGRGIQRQVGSLSNPNNNFQNPDEIFVRKLYFEQSLGGTNGDFLTFRVGKIDLTSCFQCAGCPTSFNGNRYMGDEESQFLNSALGGGGTIPFPTQGPGAMAIIRPVDWWYLSAGVENAGAQQTESSFDSTFCGNGRYFSVYETGVTPSLPSCNGALPGAYRVGFWYDAQSLPRLDGPGNVHGNNGIYTSCDQKLWNPDDKNPSCGLAAFFRFDAAQADCIAVKTAYTTGLQYQGLIPGRKDDVLAVAYVSQRLADRQNAGFTKPDESVIETYYNIKLTKWCSLSPDIQYVTNPGGAGNKNATIIGLRLQISF
jgi:porin